MGLDYLADCGPKKPDCGPKVDCGGGMDGRWWGLGMFILWFIIIAVVTWLVIFSLKPSWVLNPGTTEVNTGKVLLASIIIALIIVIIIWLIKSSFQSYYWR